MTTNPLVFQMQADAEKINAEAPDQHHVYLKVIAPLAAISKERMPLNISIVLDRSGSMSGGKLEYARSAALHVLHMLGDKDLVSMVVFDDTVTELSPCVPATFVNKSHLQSRLYAVKVGGSTNLSGGWLKGCQDIAAAARDGSINRALLLTDGEANAGIVGLEELGTHARELHSRGISTSTFGVGVGFNEQLLEYMANLGGGNYYYIDSPALIPDIFMREFKELSEVTARDVEIELSIPVDVDVTVLGGWRFEKDGARLRIFPGDIAAGSAREIILRVKTPPQGKSADIPIQGICRAKGGAATLYEEHSQVQFTYAPAQEAAAAPRNQEVIAKAAEIEVAEAAVEALKLEREGRHREAQQLFQMSSAPHRGNLSHDRQVYYATLSDEMQQGMSEESRKQAHQDEYMLRKQRLYEERLRAEEEKNRKKSS